MIWLLILLTIAQLGFWILMNAGYRRVSTGFCSRDSEILRKNDEKSPLPVSVVIAARNEERSLPELVAALDLQTHDNFEVVVVDDASDDGTATFLLEAAASRPWLRLISVEEPQFPRKKHALTLGIGAVRNDLLAFTDADCRPGPLWLERIAQYHAEFDEDVLLVGFAPYAATNGWVSRLARYDATLNGFLAAASIVLDIPYMAAGRNMSYPREIFVRAGGHSHSQKSMSGDDDLFLQHVWSRKLGKIVWLNDPETFVYSRPKATLYAWLKQKRRHSSAGRYMKLHVQILSALFVVSLVSVWLAPFLVGWAGVGLLLTWLGAHYLSVCGPVEDLDGADLLTWFPMLTFLVVVYYAVFPITGFLFPTKEWE